ncbi:MAG: S-adenosylmethionine decarboxylase [Proteobacteria bacterium]|nr:S-adenosylmethionine decarboxylase [Pseudomonadota bacterium]
MLDGFECRQNLDDIGVIYHFLHDLPGAMEMTKIAPPYVFRFDAPDPKEWGYTGVVIIAESHITIHTYPDKNYLAMDAFSCKPFDSDLIRNTAVETFDILEPRVKIVSRGFAERSRPALVEFRKAAI